MRQLSKINKIPSITVRINSLLEYAYFSRLANKDVALEACQQAIALCAEDPQREEYTAYLSRAHAILGLLYISRYQLQLAKDHASNAMIEAGEFKVEPTFCDALVTISWVHNYRKDPHGALGYAEAAVRIANLLGDQDRMISSLNTLASAQLAMGQLEASARTFSQGFALLGQDKADPAAMLMHYNHALLLAKQGSLGQALRNCAGCYNNARRAGLVDSARMAATQLGTLLAQAGKPRHALRFFGIAFTPSVLSNADPLNSKALCDWADVAADIGETAEAKRLLLHALDISQQLEDYDGIGSCLSRLSALAEKTNDPATALAWHKQIVENQQHLYAEQHARQADMHGFGSVSLPPTSDSAANNPPAQRKWVRLRKARPVAISSILLLDSDEIYLEGLKRRLAETDIQTVLACTSPAEAARISAETPTDVILAEWIDGPDNTLGLLQKIRFASKTQRVVLYSDNINPEIINQAASLHVTGFFPRATNFETLFTSLNEALRGKGKLDQLTIRRLVKKVAPKIAPIAENTPLTNRQKAIADMLVKGYLYRNMAQMMGVSERTIKREAKELMELLGASSRKTLERVLRKMA